MKWFIHADGETAGPLTFDQMAELANEGLLLRDTDVAEAGSDVWTAASADAELSSLFKKHPQMVDNYRRDDWTGVVREDATKPKRFAKLVLLAVAFITLCAGAFTIIFAVVAPGKEEHPATRAASRSSDIPQSAVVPVADTPVLQKLTTPQGWVKDGPPAQLKPENGPLSNPAPVPAPSASISVRATPATVAAPSASGAICDLAGLSIRALSQNVPPEAFLNEITSRCRRGDLVSFPSGYTYVMKKACDFSQQIVTTPREIQCVYSGALRPG